MSFNNENENNNENNNNENNNENNNNENNNEVRNMEELRALLKEEFNINPKNKKYINKLIRDDVIDEEMIEKLLNGNSRKMKAFYRWMENEVGYKKNLKTKQWFQVENNNLDELLNNENNELNNKNFNLDGNENINLENNVNNVERGNSKKNNKNKKGKKQNDDDIVNKRKLNKVLKVYFGNKEGYKLTEYENLIKISKNIGKNNSENVIKEKLSKLMEERDADNGNNKSINKNGKNNNKEGKLDTKNFVVLNLDNHCILKKANANAKLSNYNINKIPQMCSEEGVKKFFKFLNKVVSNFHFLTLEKNDDFLKTLKENKNKSLVLYLQQFDVYLYYHQKYLYILNYTTYAESKLQNFLEKFIKKSKIKKIEDILCEVNNNSLSCVCLDYLIFLSLINPKVKFKSVNKIIKDIAVEIRDFILYLCQKRVFS